MPQSEMTLSSPARSPSLCIPWAKARQRHQAGPPDTLVGRQLLSPTCHTAVAALLNGAGEREVKKLNVLTLPVIWCLGDGPRMDLSFFALNDLTGCETMYWSQTESSK